MAGGANEHQSVNRFQSIPDAGHNDFTKNTTSQNNMKLHGEISWENQIAVLSHYLHNNGNIANVCYKKELTNAIR